MTAERPTLDDWLDAFAWAFADLAWAAAARAREAAGEAPIRLGVDLDELLVAPLRRPTLPPIIIAGPALLDALALTMGDPPPQTAGYVVMHDPADYLPPGGVDPVAPDDTRQR